MTITTATLFFVYPVALFPYNNNSLSWAIIREGVQQRALILVDFQCLQSNSRSFRMFSTPSLNMCSQKTEYILDPCLHYSWSLFCEPWQVLHVPRKYTAFLVHDNNNIPLYYYQGWVFNMNISWQCFQDDHLLGNMIT